MTFDMLYDMIPNKVERFIILPYLEKILTGKGIEAYWSFLESVFGELYYDSNRDMEFCPKSFLFVKIHNMIEKDMFNLTSYTSNLDISSNTINDVIHRELVNPNGDDIADITDGYVGYNLPISAIHQQTEIFPNVRQWMENENFFMKQEYNNIKTYYEKLRRRIQDEEDSDDLFN